MSPEEEKDIPAAEEQDTDTGVDSETNDSSEDSTTDERYENQKKRAEKAEAKLKALQDSLNEDDSGDPDGEDTTDITTPDSERMDRLELRQEGYAPEVVDKIMELGGKAALANEILKKSADELQADFNARQAAAIEEGPQGTSRTKYSKEELANMSVEEMEKILPHADN